MNKYDPQLNEILKDQIRKLREFQHNLETSIRLLKEKLEENARNCHHRNPDGSWALNNHMFYDVCRICGESLD